MGKCKDCKWWWQQNSDGEGCEKYDGYCVRYAPRIVEGMLRRKDSESEDDEDIDYDGAIWPLTMPHYYCGEFEAKVQKLPPGTVVHRKK